MDSLRGQFLESQGSDSEDFDWNVAEDEIGREPPPLSVGQAERRLQVRAYNHWVGLLGPRQYPSIGQLKLEELGEFADHCVLLDLREDIDNPAIPHIGADIALEIGADLSISHLVDVPSRSLLSRITDHYMQILANQAPIGFEAEFVNWRGATMLYRGILLPFSEDDRAISHILGVINSKQLAEQNLTDALELQLEQVLAETDEMGEAEPLGGLPQPDALLPTWLGQWAQTPGQEPAPEAAPEPASVADLASGTAAIVSSALGHVNLPMPGFGQPATPAPNAAPLADTPVQFTTAPDFVAPDATPPAAPTVMPVALVAGLAAARAQADTLAATHATAEAQLLTALGQAHDLATLADTAPDAFAQLAREAGIAAGATPTLAVLRLVFGAAIPQAGRHALLLDHARRLGLPAGALIPYLQSAPGGIDGVLAEARRLRRISSGHFALPTDPTDPALAAAMRAKPALGLGDLAAEGEEFTLLVARRHADGEVVVLGEVTDEGLLDNAARHITG